MKKNTTSSADLESHELPDEMFLEHVIAKGVHGVYRTLSFTSSPAVMLCFAANHFTQAAARIYRQHYSIGVTDWRLLVMLTREPGATVSRAADAIGIDKAAVSRSLQQLKEKGLAIQGEVQANGRSRGWTLTAGGRGLHDQVLVEALARQRELFAGFSADEVLQLNGMLRRILANLKSLPAGEETDSDEPGL